MKTCTYTGTVPGDLAHGQPVEFGQVVEVDLSHAHNQMLVDEGKLLVHSEPDPKPRQKAADKPKEATS